MDGFREGSFVKVTFEIKYLGFGEEKIMFLVNLFIV